MRFVRLSTICSTAWAVWMAWSCFGFCKHAGWHFCRFV